MEKSDKLMSNVTVLDEPMFIKEGMIGVKVMPQNKNYFTLDELQKIVGGIVQIVYLKNHVDKDGTPLALLCNENGKGMYKAGELSINKHATLFWEQSYGSTDFMVGDILVTPQRYLN